ncbi:MAG: Dabb family protein [Verrucomicrobia bacterium]|nr:Dabb family protein [Verrucomicrobiota bacterium]
MIARLTLFTLKPDVTPEWLEEMMWTTRTTLLKIPEVLSLRTGKRVNPGDPWDWFIMIEVESLDKFAICQDDPHYFKYLKEVVNLSAGSQQELTFEMEPRKDVKYS